MSGSPRPHLPCPDSGRRLHGGLAHRARTMDRPAAAEVREILIGTETRLKHPASSRSVDSTSAAASQSLASAWRLALPLERLLEVVAGRLELRLASVALAFVLERLVATGATGKLPRVATEVLT